MATGIMLCSEGPGGRMKNKGHYKYTVYCHGLSKRFGMAGAVAAAMPGCVKSLNLKLCPYETACCQKRKDITRSLTEQ